MKTVYPMVLHRLAFTLAGFLLSTNSLAAQPIPASQPPLSVQEQEELQRLRQEEQIRELIRQNLQADGVVNTRIKTEIERAVRERVRDSREIDERIQIEVDRAFGHTTSILNVLLVVLTLMPLLAILGGWLLRRSVISEILSEITKSREEIKHELTRQIDLSKQEIERVKVEAKVQLESMVGEARTVLKALQEEIEIAQQELESLRDETRTQFQGIFSDVQQEKNRIFLELAKVTPSVIQAEFVTPETQQKIQELTKQLESLESENYELSLTADDYVKQGDALYFEGRFEDAIESYDKAIEIDSNLFAAWVGKGKVLRTLQRYEEALIANNRSIDIQPDNPWGWFGKGFTLKDLKRYEEALLAYERVIGIRPNHHHSWRHRGYILTKLGRRQEAFNSFNQALQIQANSSGTHYNLAYYYLTQGDFELALANLQRALNFNPKYKKIVRDDKDFQVVWENERFRQLIEDLSNHLPN